MVSEGWTWQIFLQEITTSNVFYSKIVIYISTVLYMWMYFTVRNGFNTWNKRFLYFCNDQFSQPKSTWLFLVHRKGIMNQVERFGNSENIVNTNSPLSLNVQWLWTLQVTAKESISPFQYGEMFHWWNNN